ncbi:MAG: CRTAC1 family protein [Planctomycetota bacterium]|nr:CRTAC1 family protein [Planctomycetota bacterium]
MSAALWLTTLALVGQDPDPTEKPQIALRFQALELAVSGGPASWADWDDDGWVDLNAGGELWRNVDGTTFERVGSAAPGPFGDFDADGKLDLFDFAGQRLLRGDGEGGFTPVELGELERTLSRGAALGDFNGDGHLDAYVGGYENWDEGITYADHLLLGDGAGLRVAWKEASLRARGVSACDFDDDGDLDVYVSNYRLQPNRLWRNDGQASFEDAAAELGAVATSEGFGGGHSIGACWGDFDGDGRIDLFAGNFAHVDSRGDQPKSRFLRNTDKGFEDKGTCGVRYQESYASPAAADYDNDGDLDLFFTTVYGTASFGRKNNPVLYRNDGDWTFTDVTKEEGLADLPPTYQAAWADFDRDGDLDLVSAGKLYRNTGAGGHWLRVQVSRHAIGARVRWTQGERVQVREVEAGTGEGNANELTVHFGGGVLEEPGKLEVRWPAGPTKTIVVPTLDRFLVATVGER